MKSQHVAATTAPRSVAEHNFAALADPLVSEAIAEAAALKAAPDAEKLHKLRVALRRLRTLLWAYRPILDEAFDHEQRAYLKFLANAAGNTRNWDILIELVEDDSEPSLLETFRKRRDESAESSSETLSSTMLDKVLRGAVHEANRELNTSPRRTPLTKFAQKRVTAAQKQLRKRMKRASKTGGSDYGSYHDVRKAGKKVRYLIEFFEPLLAKKQRKGVKALKTLQKHFGALNDVVSSRELLAASGPLLPEGSDVGPALRSLKRKEKRRRKAASRML